MTNMKKTANKCGVNFTLREYSTGKPYLYFDFINEYAEDLKRDRVFATGGQYAANLVGFEGKIEGTIKISTQIIPIEVIALAAGGNVATGADVAVREIIKVTEAGKLTLSEDPIAGSLYVYKLDKDCEGDPAATEATAKAVTIEGAAVGDKYVAYYFKTSTDAKTVVFNENNTSDFYTLDGYTKMKDTDGLDSIEYVKGYKLQPQQAITLTYNGGSDPISLDVTFDILTDDEGNTYSHTRV